ncbi:protein of unknown function [Cupriavidus taiwanensis]|nr:protein of unknown function [Cupriavidus taiwanensis]
MRFPQSIHSVLSFIFAHPKCTVPDILEAVRDRVGLVLTVNSEKSDGIRPPHARAGAGPVLSTIVPKRRQ